MNDKIEELQKKLEETKAEMRRDMVHITIMFLISMLFLGFSLGCFFAEI